MSEYLSALSASRAKDYMQCPLKFRFAVVDRVPQPPTVATIKGTLVHAVLENLFGEEPEARTEDTARDLVAPHWDALAAKNTEYLPIIQAEIGTERLLIDARSLIDQYFTLERPRWIEPAARESFVETRLSSGLLLRGIVDRIDRAPDGRLRVIDYKTGKAPAPRFMEEALFQMRFYALMLRQTDRLPTRMQLLYLKSGSVLTLDPDPVDIERFEEQLMGLWDQIATSAETAAFRPKKGPLCGWCSYQPRCPLFGGSSEQPSADGLERLLSMRQAG